MPLNRCGNTTCCQRRSSECPESQILSVAHFLAWVRYIAQATQSLRACCMISAASCNYWRFGSGGRQENINAICILRLNIINDKVRSRIIFCVFKGIFKYSCQTILCLTVWPGVPGTVVVVCPHITAGGHAVALQGGPGEPHLFRPVASLSPCRCRAPACGTSCWRSGSAGGRGGGTHKSNKTNIAAKSAGN